MCLCFRSVNGPTVTHQKHAGQMFCGNEVSFLYSYFSEYSHILRLLRMPEERLC